MKINPIFKYSLILFALVFAVSNSFAQPRRIVKTAAKPIVFAVMDNEIEPIGAIDKGKLVPTTGGESEAKDIIRFAANYYKPKTAYSLIFGGAKQGIVTVKSSNPKAECNKNMAEVTIQSPKAKIKGLVMALATNEMSLKTATGLRRLPTAAERTEIEMLVRAEFTKQKISADAVKNMKYHNLTAIDVDSDGKPEMVGSFWTENSADERNLLFFIAEKNQSGKYNLALSNFETIKKEDVMSGELKDLDSEALASELLIDAMDYDGDKTAEIFTLDKAFEGYNYKVYSRRDGKWSKVYEGYNYHCAY